MAKYAEFINKKLNALPAPYGVPQLFEETIDTAGYSEIRLFIHVSVDNYKQDPVTSATTIETSLFHTVTNASWPYSKKEIKSSVTSYIDGWLSEKIIGNKLRIVAFAKNFPKGPYSISATYYLV